MLRIKPITLFTSLFVVVSFSGYSQELNTLQSRDLDAAPERQAQEAVTPDSNQKLDSFQTFMGQDLRNKAGEEIGSIEDVIFNTKSGEVVYVIASTGGFLGIGSSQHALPFSLVNPVEGQKYSVVDINKERLSEAPQYDSGQAGILSEETWSESLFSYYNTQPQDVGQLTAWSKISKTSLMNENAEEVGTIQDMLVKNQRSNNNQNQNQDQNQDQTQTQEQSNNNSVNKIKFIVVDVNKEMLTQDQPQTNESRPQQRQIDQQREQQDQNYSRESTRSTAANDQTIRVLPWGTVEFDPNNQSHTLTASSDLLASAPSGYNQNGQPNANVHNSDWQETVYSYFGFESEKETQANKMGLRISNLIGYEVRNAQNESVGKIDDLLINEEEGSISSVIVSVGGFLGVGDKKFVVPWSSVKLNKNNKWVHLDMTKESLLESPVYDSSTESLPSEYLIR